MFIGHIALALAAKRVTPRVSLAMLLLAAQWADVVWPVLLAFGIEQVRIDPGNTAFTPLDFVSYPYSHSLVALVVWGIVLGSVYRGIAGGRRTFVVLAALVVSHWLLDYVTHRPDMPLYPGSAKYGLGLWNSIPATVVIETAMYAGGLWIYMQSTRARDPIGRWAFRSLVAVLMVIYVANIFGGPPPSVQVLWPAALAGAFVLTLWAWWADRHRDGRQA
jgi:membrane-bound metal-dependent hydrolase YbcI (DUF457 family)